LVACFARRLPRRLPRHTLDFQTIPNEFDDDRDGWAELLVHCTDGVSARFTPELDTDLGLIPTKTAFERKLVSPES
jgi:hypothetical protein